VTGQDFIDWVNLYMVPEGAMGVTAMDLHGARCGMLHSLTGESKKHRKQLARKVWYARQVPEGTRWLVQLYKPETLEPITVSVDALGLAVESAIGRFWQKVADDAQLAERVLERARSAYYSEGWYGGRPVSQHPRLESDTGSSLGAVVVVPGSSATSADITDAGPASAERATSEVASSGDTPNHGMPREPG